MLYLHSIRRKQGRDINVWNSNTYCIIKIPQVNSYQIKEVSNHQGFYNKFQVLGNVYYYSLASPDDIILFSSFSALIQNRTLVHMTEILLVAAVIHIMKNISCQE